MSFINRLHRIVGDKHPSGPQEPSSNEEPNVSVGTSDNNEIHPLGPNIVTEMKNLDEGRPSLDAQAGVRKIEAVTLSWSKKSLAALLVL